MPVEYPTANLELSGMERAARIHQLGEMAAGRHAFCPEERPISADA